MVRPINSRLFTSFYWLGSEVERTVIRASSVRAALEEHYECGWNTYDDRRLVDGDCPTEDALNRPRLVSSESWGEDD